jgi:hypothetical protein
MTTRASVRRSHTVPGRPEQAAAARRLVSDGLGDRPHAETAIPLVIELIPTSLRHSAPSQACDGGTITITVAANQRAAGRQTKCRCGTGHAFDVVRSSDLGLAHGLREYRT